MFLIGRLPHKISRQKRAMYVTFHIGLHGEGESVGSGVVNEQNFSHRRVHRFSYPWDENLNKNG